MLSTIYAGLVLPKKDGTTPPASGGGGNGIAFEPIADFATFIDYPEAKNYTLDVSMDFPGTIDSIVAICSSGSCTVVATINGSTVTGTSIAVSTSINSDVATAGNVYAAGDIVGVTVSGMTNPRNVAIKIKSTRTALS